MNKIIQIQSIINQEITIEEAKRMVIMHKGETYSFFDEGTTRHVFVNNENTKVIKILRKNTFFDYNEEEVNIYNDATNTDKEQMAKSELFNGIVEQDYCTPIKFGGKKLTQDEKNFAMSCRNEVGWNNHGKLICFDLSDFKKY